jgi:hypothetical protein
VQAAGHPLYPQPPDRKTDNRRLPFFFRPPLNCFKPTVKLADKIRAGGKVRRVYDKPVSPYQRLMANPKLPEEVMTGLSVRCPQFRASQG